MAVYKQRVEIHMYYNQEARANHFKALWHEAKTQFVRYTHLSKTCIFIYIYIAYLTI